MKNPSNLTYRDCKFAVLSICLLAVGACYHAPGNTPPAPDAAGIEAAAAKTFPALKEAYAANAKDAAAACKDMKSVAEFYDYLKAKNHGSLEGGFKDLIAEMDKVFDRDDKGNMIWDATKAEQMCLELAKGFE